MKKFFVLLALVMVLTPAVIAAEKLDFVILAIRHGDRAPFSNMKNAPYKWEYGFEQLTPAGMREEYNSGKLLRKRYVDEMKFLKPTYQNFSIYAITDPVNRTVQSGQCLLMGLYPPKTGPLLGKKAVNAFAAPGLAPKTNNSPALPYRFQSIPIMTTTEESHLLMIPYLDYLKVLKDHVYPTDAWKNKTKEVESNFANWSKISGDKIDTLEKAVGFGGQLNCAIANNKTLPKGITLEEAEKVVDLTSWGLCAQFKNEVVSYISGVYLLNTMIENIKDAISGKKPYKMVFYSGHDITLLPLMALLGAPLDETPAYAAHMELEVYKTDDAKHIIKLRYNGKNVKSTLMGDKDSFTLEDLSKHVDGLNKKYKAYEKETK